MKKIQWKSLFVTVLVCLLPILLGLALWEQLPDMVAIHFNINGEPDNFASKAFAVFVLPLLMSAIQVFYCILCDISAGKGEMPNKVVHIAKWILPTITMILYLVTLFYALGWNIDIRRVLVFLVGAELLVVGNYMPKFDKLNWPKVTADQARKINRFTGFATVVMGILILLSLFFPPIVSVVALILVLPYIAVTVIYSIKVSKE